MKRTVVPMLVLLLGLTMDVAKADFVFGTPANLGPNINTDSGEGGSGGLSISADGLSLYFDSNRSGGSGYADLWVATRITTDDDWDESVNLGSVVNGSSQDVSPSISADGLSLYFSSNRPGAVGDMDLWVATRETTTDDWGQPSNLGPVVNSSAADYMSHISVDGLMLYFSSTRPGGFGLRDLWMTTRATTGDDWSEPVNLGPTVNTSSNERRMWMSSDSLTLFFQSDRPRTSGHVEIWMAVRATADDDWGEPFKVGPPVNLTSDISPIASSDGRTLYFSSYNRYGGYGVWDLWQATITPIIDFNADGEADANDMTLLVDNWGENQPLFDIGPFPWGDGVVDAEDLVVFIDETTESGFVTNPLPNATEVPRDTTLSWTAVPFAETYDVYFGTSSENVSNATRDDPCGVLVNLGQPEPSYAPEGPLEFSQTYYWRVDFVGPDPALAVYEGLVQDFTTEAYAYPIQNVAATASSSQAGMGPENTVNGSGLDTRDGHSTDRTDMWQSESAEPHWIQFEFDKIYALHELRVWNSNQLVELFMGFGAKTVTIEYSMDGTTWTPLDGVPEFAKAPGKPGYVADTIVSFGGILAKQVKLTIEENWGAMSSVGLSEVRFFHIPSALPTEP